MLALTRAVNTFYMNIGVVFPPVTRRVYLAENEAHQWKETR